MKTPLLTLEQRPSTGPDKLCSSCDLCLALAGKKPTNVNLLEVMPDATRASRKADGPAIGITAWPAATAAATSSLPGSLINGIPVTLMQIISHL